MLKSKLSFLFIFGLSIAFLSCNNDDDPDIPEEEEVITTLSYTLTSSNGDAVTMSFRDLDGDGGDAPTIIGGTLSANTTYVGLLSLLNESETPAENVNEEIEEEDEEHQFFFSSTVPELSVTYGDMDEDGNPLGLVSTVTTGAAGSGTLTVILRHEPDKNAEGVPSGNISNAGGETDIEVSFDVTVQ